MSRKITFKIDNEGNILIQKVEGYGSSCLSATDSIEQALGYVDESTRVLTDEINKPVELDNRERSTH
jgi:hypothetical protein